MHYFITCACVGSEASAIVAVKQLERYPVDLYCLVDVSASMQENLDHVGVDLFELNSGSLHLNSLVLLR